MKYDCMKRLLCIYESQIDAQEKILQESPSLPVQYGSKHVRKILQFW